MNAARTAATITAAGIFGAAATGLALATPSTDVTLDVDGHSKSVSTSAQTVGALLDSEHVSHGAGTRVAPGLQTSLHSHERIEVDHPWKITVQVDGKTRSTWTTADTVRAALAEMGIKVGKNDKVSVPLTSGHKNMTVVVKRDTDTATTGTPQPTNPSPAATSASTAASTAPASPATPAATAASAGMSGAWAQVAQCETGGNPGIVAGQFYGMYMMTLDAWHAAGGTGLPSQASAAEQTARAQALYNQLRSKPWPVCGRYLP